MPAILPANTIDISEDLPGEPSGEPVAGRRGTGRRGDSPEGIPAPFFRPGESGVAESAIRNPQSAINEGWMDKAGAAKFLGVSLRSIEEWMLPRGTKRGRGLPYIKLGKSVRFRRSDIEAWGSGLLVNRPLPQTV